eukprot:scaffold88873_cov30-Phaeocystis_antarctica.AAC.1
MRFNGVGWHAVAHRGGNSKVEQSVRFCRFRPIGSASSYALVRVRVRVRVRARVRVRVRVRVR